MGNALQEAKRRGKLMKVGEYYYDFSTSNTSFLQVADDLRVNKVKNFYFHLRLHDPELCGVNPYDPNLPSALRVKVLVECIANPWYFLRECSLIPDEGGPPVRFRINRASLATIWCFINGINCYLTIARQIGKTKSIIAILLWAYLFGTSNSEFLFLHIDSGGSTGNLRTLNQQKEVLPKYMQQSFTILDDGKKDKGINNVTVSRNPVNNNKILCLGKAGSKEKAMEMGRGKSQPIQYIDESEFISYITEILGACGPAFGTASENAKKNGAVHGRIFTSTPGDLDNTHAAAMIDYIENGCKWTENFYSMPIADVEVAIKTEALNPVVYIEYPYYLLGKDIAWFNKQKNEVLNDPVRIKRELLLKRIHGSSDSPFNAEDLDILSTKKGKIVEEVMIGKIYKLVLYEKLDKAIPYFVGIDPSQSYGADNNYIIIFNPYTCKVAGSFKSANIPPTQLPKFIISLVKNYIPLAILIPERNIGATLIDALLQNVYTRNRVFYEKGDTFETSLKESKSGSGFLEEQAEFRRKCGIVTSNKTRPEMFKLLGDYVANNKEVFVDHTLIDEIMTLVRKNNKIQASNGKHDDAVMAFLLCLFVFIFGKDLDRFGFNPNIAKIVVENMHKGVNSVLADVEKTERERELQNRQKEFSEMGFGPGRTQDDADMEFYRELFKESRANSDKNGIKINYDETLDEMDDDEEYEDDDLCDFIDDVNDWM